MKVLYTSMLLLHVLGVVVWVGGMFMMHVAVRPAAVELLIPHESQVRLVHECGGLQRVSRSFPGHLVRREPAEFLVDQSQQLPVGRRQHTRLR